MIQTTKAFQAGMIDPLNKGLGALAQPLAPQQAGRCAGTCSTKTSAAGRGVV
jgi:hypothetical protein